MWYKDGSSRRVGEWGTPFPPPNLKNSTTASAEIPQEGERRSAWGPNTNSTSCAPSPRSRQNRPLSRGSRLGTHTPAASTLRDRTWVDGAFIPRCSKSHLELHHLFTPYPSLTSVFWDHWTHPWSWDIFSNSYHLATSPCGIQIRLPDMATCPKRRYKMNWSLWQPWTINPMWDRKGVAATDTKFLDSKTPQGWYPIQCCMCPRTCCYYYFKIWFFRMFSLIWCHANQHSI